MSGLLVYCSLAPSWYFTNGYPIAAFPLPSKPILSNELHAGDSSSAMSFLNPWRVLAICYYSFSDSKTFTDILGQIAI